MCNATNLLATRRKLLHDAAGNVTHVTDPNGNITQYLYNADNRLTVTLDGIGNRTTSLYDASGHVTGVLDPRRGLTQYSYDYTNRLVQTLTASGNFRQHR